MHTLIYVSRCKPQCEALLMYSEHSDSAITKIHCNIVSYVGEVRQAVAMTRQTVKTAKPQRMHAFLLCYCTVSQIARKSVIVLYLCQPKVFITVFAKWLFTGKARDLGNRFIFNQKWFHHIPQAFTFLFCVTCHRTAAALLSSILSLSYASCSTLHLHQLIHKAMMHQ